MTSEGARATTRTPGRGIEQRGVAAEGAHHRGVPALLHAPPGAPVYVEVCAGAGGWGLGMHRAGWFGTGVELDPDAAETHRRNVGPCLTGDVTALSPPHPADAVVGGVPCQGWSDAGSQLGLEDPRSQLFRDLLRFAQESGARCVAMENVRGLLHRGAVPVLREAFARAGFPHFVWQMLNSADYGVPQFRERGFFVGFVDAGDAARFRWPSPTHGPPGNLFGLPAWVTVREALGLGGTPKALSDREKELGKQVDWTGGKWWGWGRMIDPDKPAWTIGTRNNADLLERELALAAGMVGGEGGRPERPKGRRALPRAEAPGLADRLEAAGVLDRPATTVDTRPTLSAAGHHASNKAGAVRLGLAQLARLQGLPDGFSLVGDTEKSRHRQVGNLVPPGLGEAVGRALRAALFPGGDP